ncbi:MAG: hypothetical protein ABJD11_14480 [Gemmatimonadota bacterium]
MVSFRLREFPMLVIGMLLVLAPSVRAQGGAPPVPVTVAFGQLHSTTKGLPRQSDHIWALRLASPLVPLDVRYFLIEPAISYAGYLQHGGAPRHMFISEVQLQVQPGTHPIAPYLGGGVGLGMTRDSSRTVAKPVFSGSVGIRADLSQAWGITGEMRLRRTNYFEGMTRELTIGVYGTIR